VRHVVRNRRIITIPKVWNMAKVEIGAGLQLRQAAGLPPPATPCSAEPKD